MTKEKVKEIVKNYCWSKVTIVCLLLISLIGTVGCTWVVQCVNEPWLNYFGIGCYIIMIIMIIIACVFPLGRPLTELITLSDYKGILEFFIYMSENLSEQEYWDAIILVKRALNKTVYNPHLFGLNEKLVEHLRYLQGIVFENDKKEIIPKNLLNRSYLRELSIVLLQQINSDQFSEAEVAKIVCEQKQSKKRMHLKLDYIYLFCTVLLVAIVIGKLLFSINESWYVLTSENVFARVFYNIGADALAIYFALSAITKKDK